MNKFSIGEAITYGWGVFKQNKKVLVLGTLLFLFLTNIQNLYNPKEFSAIVPIVFLVSFVLGVFVQIGWYKFLIKVIDGVPTGPSELFQHGVLFFKYLGTTILFGIIIMLPVVVSVGVFLLLMMTQFVWAGVGIVTVAAILMVYLGMKYFFALPISVLEDLSIWGSFKKSFQITSGYELRLLGFSVVAGILNILGFLLFLVGSLVAVPVTTIAYLYIYRQLSQNLTSQNLPHEAP